MTACVLQRAPRLLLVPAHVATNKLADEACFQDFRLQLFLLFAKVLDVFLFWLWQEMHQNSHLRTHDSHLESHLRHQGATQGRYELLYGQDSGELFGSQAQGSNEASPDLTPASEARALQSFAASNMTALQSRSSSPRVTLRESVLSVVPMSPALHDPTVAHLCTHTAYRVYLCAGTDNQVRGAAAATVRQDVVDRQPATNGSGGRTGTDGRA